MKSLLWLVILGGIVAAVSTRRNAGADEPPADTNPALQEAPRGFGLGRGQQDDPRFIEDRNGFHFLLDNRAKIRRTTTRLPNGVETITESESQDVADGIRAHVASMHGRVKDGRGIHLRDPLFREVFRNADKIAMEITDTEKGVRVVETSDDPFVAILLQAHAEVVNRFVEHGHDEVRKNHPVPRRPE